MFPYFTEHYLTKKNARTDQWRGLGWWNLYFIFKLFLYWTGHINLHIFYNIVFAFFLIIPIPAIGLYRLRDLLAIPAGIALFYYDSWFPPLTRLFEQTEVFKFSNQYLLELALRFINWELIGASLLIVATYFFWLRWFKRLTLCVMSALVLVSLTHWSNYWVPYLQLAFTHIHIAESSTNQQAEIVYGANAKDLPEPTLALDAVKSLDQVLDDELALFYEIEQERVIPFDAQQAAGDFDIVFFNICSLSWDDLRATGYAEHPLFAQMDIIFEQFNAATSYSSPAVLRLLRANCGQPAHHDLYEPAPQQCLLFSNLQALGFDTQVTLNHDGQFQNLLDDLQKEPAFAPPLIPSHLDPVLTGFDESPVWNDFQTLDFWWQQQTAKEAQQPTALLYNSITLHDGNRELGDEQADLSAPYDRRVKALLDDLHEFMTQLEDSGREVLVVFIPEHGAAFRGDQMQVTGLREIPTQKITLVPVGLRFIGAASHPEAPVQINGPSSFLALAELVKRIMAEQVFEKKEVDWSALVEGLPETPLVSENEAAVALWHEGKPYVRILGRSWAEYTP